jgi:hypothetical protein
MMFSSEPLTVLQKPHSTGYIFMCLALIVHDSLPYNKVVNATAFYNTAFYISKLQGSNLCRNTDHPI